MAALASALAAGAARCLLALAAALCCPPCAPAAATLNTVLVNSNAIKNGHSGPGGGGGGGGAAGLVPIWAVSAAPGDLVLFDRPNGYIHVDNKHQQHFPCVDEKDCDLEEYCDLGSRGGSGGGGGGGSVGLQVCLPCRKRRRRCQRNVMCCPGNFCSNGICVPLDQNHLHAIEMDEMTTEPVNNDPSLLEGQPRRTTPSAKTKGQEGAVCLRSSDCADGLCCARHFWSKICKPVLKEGQVCTKHRRKGSHGLEIFQRCFCAEGLTCRVQKDHLTNNASRLHTCQKH
ncbi:dickkopf-related protein 1 [Sarcophilus harrisii]|uniref:Dickkopf WNT signaling pathway inhibitor 1 n=1 Tax=Sarcophilus harrisii TaxID=9305 RepID=G3WQK8_SARHA|nr:dickkopf-related protein 1 [Sarcophilus harrisii]